MLEFVTDELDRLRFTMGTYTGLKRHLRACVGRTRACGIGCSQRSREIANESVEFDAHVSSVSHLGLVLHSDKV